MRSMYLLDDERAIVKRVAKIVKHGTDEARQVLIEYGKTDTGEESLRRYGEKRKVYTIRAYDTEWEIIQGVMRVAKRHGNYQPTRALLTRLENAVLD